MVKRAWIIALVLLSSGGAAEVFASEDHDNPLSSLSIVSPPNFRLSGRWQFSRNQQATGRAFYIDGDQSETDPESIEDYDSDEIGLPEEQFASDASYDGESGIMILDMSENATVVAAQSPSEPLTSAQFRFQLDDEFKGDAIDPIARATDVTPGCRVSTGYGAFGQFSGDMQSDELVLIYYMYFSTLPGESEPCFEYLVKTQNDIKRGRNPDDFWMFLVNSGTVDPDKIDLIQEVEIGYSYTATKIES
jgi:hypothetical protein